MYFRCDSDTDQFPDDTFYWHLAYVDQKIKKGDDKNIDTMWPSWTTTKSIFWENEIMLNKEHPMQSMNDIKQPRHLHAHGHVVFVWYVHIFLAKTDYP